MDVSIAVSLIRGQMGAVVERAVNGAVETVLAEMLKVVGVKFEELKVQVALMQRDVASLQREKAQKEKENDNIRAKLRYTELKLKYYRQGVEEELQQRVSASTLSRIHPSIYLQAQRGGAGVSSTEISLSCSTQIKNPEGPLTASDQECSSSHSTSKRAIGVRCHSDAGDLSSDTSDLLLPVSLSLNTPTESSQDSSTERDAVHIKDQENECEWTATLQPHTEAGDALMVPPPVQALTLDPGQKSADGSPSPHVSNQADSSTLLSSAPQVKQEEEEQVICIKEEPEEEQDVMANLLLDCQLQQDHLPESEAQRSLIEWSGLPASQRNNSGAYSSAAPCSGLMPQPLSSLQSMGALPSGIPHRQAVRQWTKDLSLYEEYKMRRNELRKRSINRRRELEKTLPQPMLADLVRDRREKTRLRVARWRAKRKIQACVNQAPAPDGAAGLCQTGFPISSQNQQLRVTCAATSGSHQRQMLQSNSLLNNLSRLQTANSISTNLPFTPSTSPLLRGPNMAPHPHTVTSSSSSFSQAPDGAAGLCQTGFPISSQHQQLRLTGAATSSSQQRQMLQSNSLLNNMSRLQTANSISTNLPFTPSTSSSSSPLLRGPNMAPHPHSVTSSSSSYPQVSLLQQSISLTDTDILQ